MVNITTKLAKSTNYTKGRTKSIQYLVIHFTANDGDTDTNNGNYFANNILKASAHYFVDEDSITQSVMDIDTAWHCGTTGTYYHAYCRNINSIGIEMCSDVVGSKYVITEDTIKNTVDLVKMLMAKYNIPLSNIVRHYDITHKSCPEPFIREPKQWEDFKARLVETKPIVVNTSKTDESSKVTILNKDNGYEFKVDGFMKGDKNYTATRELLEAFGFKIGWENGKVTVSSK